MSLSEQPLRSLKYQCWADRASFRTLAGMFPDLDRDLIDDVVREKQGR